MINLKKMIINIKQTVLLILMSLAINTANAANVMLTNNAYGTEVSVKSWKELRDQHIVKQDLDYSCGAASAATILNGFYGLNVTEKELLDLIKHEHGDDGAASFQDLAEAVNDYGMKGMGLALGFEELKKLKVPAIAYMKYRDNDHFSVIRGVSENGTVLLGDPSWGNRKFTQHQFLSMWETRDDDQLKEKSC